MSYLRDSFAICSAQVYKQLKLDLYDRSSVIFNSHDKFIKYLLSQNGKKVLVLSAAFRGARDIFKDIKEKCGQLECREFLGEGRATVTGDETNITFMTLANEYTARGLQIDQLVLVFPYNMNHEMVDCIVAGIPNVDVIIYTGEI